MQTIEHRKNAARNWFEELAVRIIAGFETLEKICAALECQPGDLLEHKNI